MVFSLLSCEKIFKDDKLNSLPLKTMDDYNQAIAGLYNRLYNGVMGDNLTIMLSIGNGDDLRVDGYNGMVGSCYYKLNDNIFNNCGISAWPEDYSGPYKLFYQAIGSANDIISKVGDINKLSPAFKEIMGEVYFIRAYCYFRLVRMYGQVPLVANPDVDFTLPKPSFTEIYDFIVADLFQVMKLLPSSNDLARVKFETPNRGTAKAFLAEVYLTMGGYPVNDNSKYADAAREAGEVIDSAGYFGFGLLPDLADLWNGSNERNQESEFSFYGYKAPMMYSYNPYASDAVAPDFYNSFPRNYRKENSFQTRKCIDTYDSINSTVINNETIYHIDTIGYIDFNRICYKKFYTQFDIPDSIIKMNIWPNLTGHIIIYPSYKIPNTAYAGHIVYLFRYAHTLLTFSEAKARSGSIDAKANEAINQVRRRANKVDLFSPSKFDLQPGLTPQQFADSVVQERAWEMCGEPEGRWFDMLRLGITKDMVKIKQHQWIIVYVTGIDRTTFFLPIPEKDIALNPNLQ